MSTKLLHWHRYAHANCQKVMLSLQLENEHICNSHSQARWGFSILLSHRLQEASFNTSLESLAQLEAR